MLTLLGLSFLTTAFAVDLPAGTLYQYCLKNSFSNNNVKMSQDDEFSAGYCVGFIKGLDDMLYLHYTMKKNRSKKIWIYCMPNGVTLNDMSDVYIAYMKKHPELSNEEAGKILIDALADKYPC